MLMLSCVHDPCINCASSAYAEQVYIKGQSKDVTTVLLSNISARYAGNRLCLILPLSLSLMPLLPQSLSCPPRTLSIKPRLRPSQSKRKKHNSLYISLTIIPQQARKSFITVKSTANKKFLITALHVGPTFVLNAPSTVLV